MLKFKEITKELIKKEYITNGCKLRQLVMSTERVYNSCKGIIFPDSFSYLGHNNDNNIGLYPVAFSRDSFISFEDISIRLPIPKLINTSDEDFLKYIIDSFKEKIIFTELIYKKRKSLEKSELKNRGIVFCNTAPVFILYYFENILDPGNIETSYRNEIVLFPHNLFKGMYYSY